MPMIRKVISLGRARGVSLPKGWLDYYADLRGEPIKEVLMEVAGDLIVIQPRLPGPPRQEPRPAYPSP